MSAADEEDAVGGMDWPAVGEAINNRLRELDWTQAELSQRSRVSVATIRQIQTPRGEVRRRNPRTLQAISEALGWSPDHLEAVANGRDPAEDPDREDPIIIELRDVRSSLSAITDRLDAIERRLDGDDVTE